jgi:hypothetical protein
MKPEFYKLLDQMIEHEEIMEARAKLNSKAEDRVGDSWILHHLKLLKEIVDEE